jgi:hypothetical protein
VKNLPLHRLRPRGEFPGIGAPGARIAGIGSTRSGHGPLAHKARPTGREPRFTAQGAPRHTFGTGSAAHGPPCCTPKGERPGGSERTTSRTLKFCLPTSKQRARCFDQEGKRTRSGREPLRERARLHSDRSMCGVQWVRIGSLRRPGRALVARFCRNSSKSDEIRPSRQISRTVETGCSPRGC